MYDYKTAMEAFFRNFYVKEQNVLNIVFDLSQSKTISMDSLSKLYADKFDQQFLLKGYIFAPPDTDADNVLQRSNLISFFSDAQDKARVNTYLAKYETLFSSFPSLESLLNLSLFKY